MDVTLPVKRSFADEHVIGIDPPMRPDLPNVWRRRINAFTGRALSDTALTAEQALRSGMQRLGGLALSPGIVDGLVVRDVSTLPLAPLDETVLEISVGSAVARSGEDISIGRPVRLAIADLPVIARVDHADAIEGVTTPIAAGGAGGASRVLPRRFASTLGALSADDTGNLLPRAAILIAQPVVAEILGRPVDPCGLDPRDDPYIDLQRIDGARLMLYMWPGDVSGDGGLDYRLPSAGSAFRNRLARCVFENEARFSADDAHPWEEWGVPLALVGFDDAWQLRFVDRHAVARQGGQARARGALFSGIGNAPLWQARIDQFTDHLTGLDDWTAERLREEFLSVPPVGVLPPSVFDPVVRHQNFFPPSQRVVALPVAMSNFNLMVSEAAALAPIDLWQEGDVELLVPVPDEVYEPGLLERAAEDQRFGPAIRDLRTDRQRWLIQRQMARRRYDRLSETLTGQVRGWPAADLPLEENSPAPYVQVPVEVSRTRRFAEASAMRTHGFSNANASLTINKSDTIWCWLCIHNRSGLTGLSIRLAVANDTEGRPVFSKGIYWGDPDAMPIADVTLGLDKRKVGDVPEALQWVRLTVPASAIWDAAGDSLDGVSVTGVQFTQRGGDVEWASFGKEDATGLSYTYLADDAPAGAQLSVFGSTGAAESGWVWTDVPQRTTISVPDFGTVMEDDVRRTGALDKFRSRWAGSTFLHGDMAAIDEGGIGAFLHAVDARLKATNDAIDLGFVRARSDIYRVRQIMLGADAASRLVTSPALADLALRDEGARATSKGISDYLLDSLDRDPVKTAINIGPKVPGAAPAPAPAPTPTPSGSGEASWSFLPTYMVLNTASYYAPPPPPPPPPAPVANYYAAAPMYMAYASSWASPQGGSSSPAPAPAPAPAPPPPPPTSVAPAPAPSITSLLGTTALFGSLFQGGKAGASLAGFAAAADAKRYTARDIQRQIPVAGLIERTVSVAERLTPQPAVQAMTYAIASKAAVLETLIGLATETEGRPTGIALGDIPVAGFLRKDDNTVPKLIDFVADPTRADIEDLDGLPDRPASPPNAKFHEADYFTAAVQAIDNSIAIMRTVEARVSLFEDLAESLRDLTAEVNGLLDEAASFLRGVDVEVAEARHDLATAERLRLEDQERAKQINARRAEILSTRVSAIAWRRVRGADLRDDVPVAVVSSALLPNPIVQCRQEHDDVPDEIHDYVQLLREVPVAWFPGLAAMVRKIERLDGAHAAIRTMIERAQQPRTWQSLRVAAPNHLLRAVQSAMLGSRQFVEKRRVAVASLDVTRLSLLTLADAHQQLTQASTIGDLVSGSHRQPQLTRAANEELEGLSAIAGCLHESFGDVPSIVRLQWAELLSAFDRPAPLRALAGLPSWAEVDVDVRRRLQNFVDWLFARVDPHQPDAVEAVNELVRICLLMASHSPVEKLIPARLVEPVPAKVGGKIALALDVTRIRRGMMTLIRNDRDQIVSRAVVEDIADGRVQAVITQVSQPIATITSALRFQLVGGPKG